MICLIQSFQRHTVKEKQPGYNNKVKMYARLFILFSEGLLKITGESTGLSSLSTQLLLGTDEASPSGLTAHRVRCHLFTTRISL